MKTFNDLEIKDQTDFPNGKQAKMFFDNGYGVSLIKTKYSYGGEKDLWELAILYGNAEGWDISYSTGITKDVMGWLTEDDVTEAMEKVQLLKA